MKIFGLSLSLTHTFPPLLQNSSQKENPSTIMGRHKNTPAHTSHVPSPHLATKVNDKNKDKTGLRSTPAVKVLATVNVPRKMLDPTVFTAEASEDENEPGQDSSFLPSAPPARPQPTNVQRQQQKIKKAQEDPDAPLVNNQAMLRAIRWVLKYKCGDAKVMFRGDALPMIKEHAFRRIRRVLDQANSLRYANCGKSPCQTLKPEHILALGMLGLAPVPLSKKRGLSKWQRMRQSEEQQSA